MMKVLKGKGKSESHRIDGIGITTDRLSSRGGLALFVRYLSGIGLLGEFEKRFRILRKSAKGICLIELFKQVICFLMDGTSRHLTRFDVLKQDEGYAGGIETDPSEMASSHAVKRFFGSFSWPLIWVLRFMLQQLFIWRLRTEKPGVVVLGLDTMVMDNNEAAKRHGVEPTYKKVAGFQPLQMTWGRYVVDAVFRGGSKHSNHGDTVRRMVLHLVATIRTYYRGDAPIVLILDSGFFDQKLFAFFEGLEIGYICGGRMSEGVKDYVKRCDASAFRRFQKADQAWDYLEFGDRLASWDRFRRAVFCRPVYEGRQALLPFARPDTVIYTNLGMGQWIDERLEANERLPWLSPQGLIALYHGRGRDELVFRSLKDFGFEEMPFKRFAPYAAFYYLMLISFFLGEAYKEDVLSGVVAVTAYPTTLRRRAIDFAAKIVRTGGRTLLKVTQTVWNSLNMALLWERSGHPPRICWE